jgi:hypothetical protein
MDSVFQDEPIQLHFFLITNRCSIVIAVNHQQSPPTTTTPPTMSTSANPIFQKYSPTTQVTLHVSLKVAQAAGMLAPPLYIIATLARRRPLTVNRLMRASAVSVVAGAGVGTALGYLRLMNEPQDKIVDRMERLVSTSMRTGAAVGTEREGQ